MRYVVVVALIAGGIIGIFLSQEYSAELLNQISVSIAAFAAFSAGAFNLYKLQQQKQQQRWELQKPMLLGLVRGTRRLIKIQADIVSFNMSLESANSDGLIQHYKKLLAPLEKEYSSLSRECFEYVIELDEVWAKSLSDSFLEALNEYRDSHDEIEHQLDHGEILWIEAFEKSRAVMEEFLPVVKKACVKQSGVGK